MALHLLCILSLNPLLGQEVRRAKPLSEMDLVLEERRETLEQEKQRVEANKAEQRAIAAAMARLKAQAAYIRSMPTSEYKIQAWDRLLAEQDRVSDWQDRLDRRIDNDQVWADQNEIAWQKQLAAASKRQADSIALSPISQEDQDFIDRVNQMERQQRAAANNNKQPEPEKPAEPNQKDCLIVATEAHARLQKSAYWAKIAGFRWFENAKNVGGHAVVFYQPTADSNIWMYDKSGSYEIDTKSHELDEIIGALNASLGGSTIRIESPRWLESGGKDKEFTSADRQPAWPSVTKSASQRTTEQTGSSAQGLAVFAFAIALGVGLRYAGIRLWPLYIVAGPVYNLIEYARRRSQP